MKFFPLLAAILAFATSAAHAESIVIVHGAFQSSSEWQDVEAGLVAKGHSVSLVELPGRDATGDAAKSVALQDYVEITQAAVQQQATPVVLVGHSFGGMTISAVAEAAPNNVAKLVYVAAYVPIDGESMEKIALTDADNSFSEDSFVIAPDYSYAEILERDRGIIFGNVGTETQQQSIVSGLMREPLAPIATPVALTEGAFGSVQKTYIRTLQDEAVSTPLQTRMIERSSIEHVIDIDTGHVPQTTAVEALVEAIDELARTQ